MIMRLRAELPRTSEVYKAEALNIRKLFIIRVVKHWTQVVQRCGGGTTPGDIHSQTWCDPEQPDVISDIPVHCSQVGQDDFWRLLPTWCILSWLRICPYLGALLPDTAHEAVYNRVQHWSSVGVAGVLPHGRYLLTKKWAASVLRIFRDNISHLKK